MLMAIIVHKGLAQYMEIVYGTTIAYKLYITLEFPSHVHNVTIMDINLGNIKCR